MNYLSQGCVVQTTVTQCMARAGSMAIVTVDGNAKFAVWCSSGTEMETP